MKLAQILAEPDRGLSFVAAELVRSNVRFSAAAALEEGLAEIRRRGGEPTAAGISSARVAARTAASERLARLNAEDAKRLAEDFPPRAPFIPLATTPGPVVLTSDSADDAINADLQALMKRAREIGSPASTALALVLTRELSGMGKVIRDMRAGGARLASFAFDPDAAFQPPAWLVKGLLPRQGIGLLFGESGSGKTFLAIHAAFCVLWGLPFFGNRTRQGGVIYVAAEGGSSISPRLRAAESALGPAIAAQRLTGNFPERAPFEIVTEAPNLSRDGDPRPMIATIEDKAAQFSASGSRLALIIIDTWHSVFGGGDENSAADAGAALAPLRDLAEMYGALVLVVHHPGKDVERGARGSNALPAAADAIISLSVLNHGGAQAKPASAVRKGIVTKLRDGDAGAELSYRLPITQLGVDDDGDPWTTCTVEPFYPAVAGDDGMTKGEREFMSAMNAGFAESSSGRVSVKEARLRYYASRPDGKPAANRMAFNRSLDAAVKAGRAAVDDGEEWVWAGSGDAKN